MIPDDFCAFILTHGRPDNVVTYKTLKRQGYTGKIYIIIDNEDDAADRYYKNFGDKVIMFDKKAISKTFDKGDNFDDRRSIVYARNACFKIAKTLGIKYFIQLDDDYTKFDFRINGEGKYPSGHYLVCNSLGYLFGCLLKFYRSIDVCSIAIAQGGDFIGGSQNNFADFKLKRKAMNTFICSTDRVFKFVGRINEDVNTYTRHQSIGNVFLTVPLLSITQKQTQSSTGGMTGIYIDGGTYIKSFYTILFSPSCTKINLMGTANKRLHHQISWKNAVPVIIDERYKKVTN